MAPRSSRASSKVYNLFLGDVLHAESGGSSFIRSSFPGAVVMYRTAPDVRPRTPEDQESLSVFELNQSSRAVMKQLGVPLFNCRSYYHFAFVWSNCSQGPIWFADLMNGKTSCTTTLTVSRLPCLQASTQMG